VPHPTRCCVEEEKLGLRQVDWPAVLRQVVGREDLDEATAAAVLSEVMDGDVDPARTAGLLTALRTKGESASEIAGFVRAMMDHVAAIELEGPLVDTCGTGGAGDRTFNVSTLVAVVVAAAGVRVAKHGNRAASGRCGSADLLEAWGVVIDLPPPAVAACVRELGIGFLFARTFHPAMRHVAPIRASLGIPTVFNVLGPLSNPARAEHQVVGVADARLAPVMADALARLGRRHALVFRGDDGLDELTTTGPSRMWEIRDGDVVASVFDPADLGIPRANRDELAGGDIATNVAVADRVLQGHDGPATDLVALNAGAALYAADAVDDLAAGLARARDVLQSGAATDLRDRWVAVSQRLAER
jgi:anthranilate phosphoribosyltransferase